MTNNNRKQLHPSLLVDNIPALTKFTGLALPAAALREAINTFFSEGVLLTPKLVARLYDEFDDDTVVAILDILGEPGIRGWKYDGTQKRGKLTDEDVKLVVKYVKENLAIHRTYRYAEVAARLNAERGLDVSTSTVNRAYLSRSREGIL